MWHRFKDWWIHGLFGPRGNRLFMLRIRARVLKLRFLLWWRGPKVPTLRHHWRKPAALLIVGVFVPILTGWLLRLAFPAQAEGFVRALDNLVTGPTAQPLLWRDAAQMVLVLIGVPSAFLLWLFRDINVSGTLDNQRKDVNLKEFQEIQMRAAGAMDEKLPATARETLQIAALHQLRAFLRGEYGKSFRRPAFELLRARFVASAQVTGSQAVADWLFKWRADFAREQWGDPGPLVLTMSKELRYISLCTRRDRVAETERIIAEEEWQAIFRSGLPLAESVFDLIQLSRGQLLATLELRACRFIAATLYRIHLELADLSMADLAGAALNEAHLEGARLDHARLERADLSAARLEKASLNHASLQSATLAGAVLYGVDLRYARCEGATFLWAILTRADLSWASLRGASLKGARARGANFCNADLRSADLSGVDVESLADCTEAKFDGATRFADDWYRLSEAKRNEARKPWLRRGAVCVDPAPEGTKATRRRRK